MKRKSVVRSISLLYVFALVLVLGGQALPQSKKDQKKVRDLLSTANKNFNQRNFQAAVDGYAEILQIDPKNAAAHFWKGAAHVNLKQSDQALTEFDAAINNGYNRPLDVYQLRWGINLEKKNYDAALDDVKKGLQLDPDNRDLRLALADISYGQGSYQEALDAYQKVLPTAANRGDVYFRIASSYEKLGDFQHAIDNAQNAVRNGTRYVGDAYMLIGDGYRRLKKWDEAGDAYQRAMAAKPGSYDLYRDVAELYRSQGRFNDAILITRRGLSEVNQKIGELSKDPSARERVGELKKTAASLYTDASWFYSLDGRYDDAVSAAQAGIQLNPDESVAYTNLCRAYNDQAKYPMAITACNNALRLSPDDGETYYYLGRANSMLGKTAEAEKAYNKAVSGMEKYVQDHPDYSDGFYILGNAYYADNQLDKAVEAYTKCLELSPRFVRARYNLGVIQVVKKNRTAAMEQYNSLLALDPTLAAKLKTEIDKL
jgi:superkiller protein 3